MVSQQTPKSALDVADLAHIADGGSPALKIDWVDPIRFTRRKYGPDVAAEDVFPPSLAKFVRAVSTDTQTPVLLSGLLTLSLIATCCQLRFEVSAKPGYIEPLSLWVVIVLPPANRKSATFDRTMAPIVRWEMRNAAELKSDIAQRGAEIEVAKKQMEEFKAKAAKAKTKDDRDSALAEYRSVFEAMPEPLVASNLFAQDITAEATEQKLVDQGGRFAIQSDEGGMFGVFAGHYTDGKVRLDVFLKGHSGGSLRTNRLSRKAELPKIAISIGLTVQPHIITEMQAKKDLRGVGLSARFLFAVPESQVGRRDMRASNPVPAEIEQDYAARLIRLLEIQPMRDFETGQETARILSLSDEALDVWHEFSQFIENKQGEFGEYAHIQDWTGKLAGQVLRIAAVCHLFEHGVDSPVIGVESIQRAIKLGCVLIEHAEIVLGEGTGSETQATADARYLAGWIEQHGAEILAEGYVLRHGDIQALGRFNKCEAQRLYDALSVLERRNILGPRQSNMATKKPTYFYYVNPLFINNAGADRECTT